MHCSMRVLSLVGVLSGVLAAGPSVAAEPKGSPDKPHLVYVGRMLEDGSLADETQVRCDLGGTCEIPVRLGRKDIESLILRIFAEDNGGFSIVPIGSDKDGNLAVGRRRDFGWGPAHSATATVLARPLKPAVDEDSIPLFGLAMREDAPAVATVVVAVKELRPAFNSETQ